MTFQDSVATCLRKYVTFDGRASRSEYWWFVLFSALVLIVSGMISDLASTMLSVALILPMLAAGARRLHDIGKSGWFLLLNFIPIIGGIILLVWACKKSEPHANVYGAAPDGAVPAVVEMPPGAV